MGFLGNTPKKRKRPADGLEKTFNNATDRKRRRVREEEQYQSTARRLDQLPAEILQYTFILSGNFYLPEVSRYTYYKLAGNSRYLHQSLLKRHAVELREDDKYFDQRIVHTIGRAVNVNLCLRRFVTDELLSDMGITIFYSDNPREHRPCYIPIDLENSQSNRSVNVVIYMLTRNCINHSHSRLIISALESGRSDVVDRLLQLGAKFDYRSLIVAYERNNLPVCKMLIELGEFDNDYDLWEYVRSNKRTDIFEFLRSEGVLPAYKHLN